MPEIDVDRALRRSQRPVPYGQGRWLGQIIGGLAAELIAAGIADNFLGGLCNE